jgi:hypothetical protein
MGDEDGDDSAHEAENERGLPITTSATVVVNEALQQGSVGEKESMLQRLRVLS